MADMVSQSSELKMEALFVDGDTRTFSVKDPKSNINQADITALKKMANINVRSSIMKP